jgi:hypothetical protein
MKTLQNQGQGSAAGSMLLMLLVLMAWHSPTLPAQTPPPEQPPALIDFEEEYSIEPSDLAACQSRLHRIHEALEWHRERNQGALPDQLSDLLGFYLPNTSLLICPFVERTGRSKGWRYGFRSEVWSDQQTSYAYEFSQSPLSLYGTSRTTLHEYKLRQVQFLNRSGVNGGMVPIVRCFAHRPVLNLSYAGSLYTSDIHWEDLPVLRQAGIDHHDLIANVLFADRIRDQMKQIQYPPRDPACAPEQLDLSAHYNATLTMAWHPYPPENSLSELPHGLCAFGDLTYDVRGVIQLKSQMLTPPFPKEILGIAVRQQCRRIHFLHATAFEETPNTRIGHYLVRYIDGQEQEIPIVYGRDVQDWWFDPRATASPGTGSVVWTGENEPTRTRGMGLRLFHSQWDNPRDQVEVLSIDYLSAMTASAPFLIAITIE